jgi:tRNA pseudouridine38-40 synthase
MPTYKFLIEYQGSDFSGWQIQKNGRSIQQCLEEAVSTVARQKVRVLSSSRTDAGVHALGQVGSFQLASDVDVSRVEKSINAILPPEVVIRKLEQTSDQFHPIRDSKGKIYQYTIWHGYKAPPNLRHYCWTLPFKIDWSAIRSNCPVLIGKHDFSSFKAADSLTKTSRRTIYDMKIIKKDSLIKILIFGDGFLKQMCRSIVGSLVDVGAERMTSEEFKGLIETPCRGNVGQTAPPGGLSLVRVFFDALPLSLDDFDWDVESSKD